MFCACKIMSFLLNQNCTITVLGRKDVFVGVWGPYFGAAQVWVSIIWIPAKMLISYTRKNATLKFAPFKYTLKLGFAQTTDFGILGPIFGVWPPYLGGGVEISCPNFSHANLGRWASKKLMPRRFSASWTLIPKFGVVPETWKSGWHQLFWCPTPKPDMAPVYMIKM